MPPEPISSINRYFFERALSPSDRERISVPSLGQMRVEAPARILHSGQTKVCPADSRDSPVFTVGAVSSSIAASFSICYAFDKVKCGIYCRSFHILVRFTHNSGYRFSQGSENISVAL